MIDNGAHAVARMVNMRANQVGMCLKAVREALDIPPLFPTAEAALRHAAPGPWPAGRMPLGAPVWFHTPSGQGHVALAVGSGYVVSTDYPTAGRISIVHCDDLELHWGARLVGYSRTLNGRVIPWL